MSFTILPQYLANNIACVQKNCIGKQAKEVTSEMTDSQIYERKVVAQAIEGDLQAFRHLVEKYERRVFAVALGMMGTREDAEDVTQEAFLKAFRNLKSFRGQSSFYTWIYRIVFNLSVDEKRRKYRHVESSISEESDLERATEHSSRADRLITAIPTPDEMYRRGELRSELAGGLQQLSPEHRAVIILREFEGYSYEEISSILKCSKGTVMSRLHHARKRLQVILQKVSDEQENESVVERLQTPR